MRGLGFGAVRDELQNGLNLFPRHAEFRHEFVHAHVLKVLEYVRNRRSGSPKHPCAAALAGKTLHGGALGPIESCSSHLPALFSIVNLVGHVSLRQNEAFISWDETPQPRCVTRHSDSAH